MKQISLCVLSVLCVATQAMTFPQIVSVSLTLIGLTQPVSCFFGIFRRRKSPPIEETMALPQADPFSFQPMSGGMFNPFGGLGAGGMFYPGFNNPGIGMFNNRFPPQFNPPPKPQSMPGTPLPPNFPPQQVPGMQQFPPQKSGMQFPQQQMPSMQQFQQMPPMPSDMEDFGNTQDDDVPPGMNTEEAESFFTLLSETDESKCISRLVCEMGANPDSGGEFGRTIVEIIGSLQDFPDGSKVSEYNEVLNIGIAEGLSACLSKFSICDDESFQLVKKAQLEDETQSK